MNIALRLQNLVVGYQDNPLCPPLNLELPDGSRLGIIGGNGTGKSTLLKTLLGLIPGLSGSYEWKGGTTLGYVPQENQIDTLFPLTVIDLIKMGLAPDLPRFRRSNTLLQEQIQVVLGAMALEGKKRHLFRELSGGEKQRALIARAWVSRPSALLMDEPFNSLDHQFKERLWRFFMEETKGHPLTLMMIDHDLNRILNHVDYMVVLGPCGTLCGPLTEVLVAEKISQVYGAPVHVHKEDDQFQVHFL